MNQILTVSKTVQAQENKQYLPTPDLLNIAV